MRLTNVIGDDMSSYYDKDTESGRNYLEVGDRQQRILGTAVIHHYGFRSEEDLARRLQRGTGGNFFGQMAFKGVINGGYLKEFLANFSRTEDTTLADYWRGVLAKAKRFALPCFLLRPVKTCPKASQRPRDPFHSGRPARTSNLTRRAASVVS